MYQLQLLLNIPELFTSQSKIDFYSSMLKNLDLSSIPEFPSSSPGRKGYSHHALFSQFNILVLKGLSEHQRSQWCSLLVNWSTIISLLDNTIRSIARII